MITSILIPWVSVFILLLMMTPIMSIDSPLPSNQLWARSVALGLFAPLSVAICLGIALYRGVPWLARGFKGLYRSYFPEKVKLPKARVL